MLLFCFPHAGASSLSYIKWKENLHPSISLIAMDLPGHGTKNGLLLNDFQEAVNILFKEVSEKLQTVTDRFAFFGHSIGCLFAYELYYMLLKNKDSLPCHLFFSGRRPPFLEALEKLYNCNDLKSFKKYLTENGLIQKEVFSEEIQSYFDNILFHDLQVVNSYQYKPKSSKILSDITVMWGADDLSTPFRDLKKWNELCQSRIHFAQIGGDHLFPVNHAKDTVQIINSILTKITE